MLALAVLLAAPACRKAPEAASAPPPASEAAALPSAEAPADVATTAASPRPPDRWVTWDEGSAFARQHDVPMVVFVHTDWCSQCRRLEPVFEQEEVLEAMRGLVRVSYNSDDNAAWIRDQVGNRDTYVPRVLFLSSAGELLDLHSDHARYPYFYAPSMVERLIANMRAAQAGG